MNRLPSLIVLVAGVLMIGSAPPAVAQDREPLVRAGRHVPRAAAAPDKEPALPVAREKWDLSGFHKNLVLDDLKYDGKKTVTVTLKFTQDTPDPLLKNLLLTNRYYFHFYQDN